MADMLLAFRLHADQHYRGPDGKPTSEIHEVRLVIRAVRELYADTPISQFTPLSVKAARAQWVKEGRSRSECNRPTYANIHVHRSRVPDRGSGPRWARHNVIGERSNS